MSTYVDAQPKKHSIILPPSHPPPPDTDNWTERIISGIGPGRLSIVCIEGANLRRKDANESRTILKPKVKISLGQNSNESVTQESNTYPCMTQNPSFGNETLSFDVGTPTDIVSIDGQDIKLKIEVVDGTMLTPFIVGQVMISATRFFTGNVTDEWIPLIHGNDKSSNSSIHLQFSYMFAKDGMLKLDLRQCKKLLLPNTNEIPSHTRLIFHIDPTTKETKDILDNSGNPSYSSEILYFHVNEANWFGTLDIQIVNLSEGPTSVFGEYHFDFLPIVHKLNNNNHIRPPLESTFQEVPLLLGGNQQLRVGTLTFQAEFLQSSLLKIKVIRAKALSMSDSSSQTTMCPIVAVSSEGKSSNPEYHTDAIHDGGASPTWNQTFDMSVIDHSKLSIECFHKDTLTGIKTLIGRGQTSLLPVYRSGFMSTWINLTRSNEVGAAIPCGQILLELQFDEVGSGYPKLHESSDTARQKKPFDIGRIAQPSGREVIHAMTLKHNNQTEEFSIEEIRKTFSFLDLDKNGYIGPNELRHVLINMGEMVTDEEIDVMISILDKNGDGQVNYQQFEAMAKSNTVEVMDTMNSHSYECNEQHNIGKDEDNRRNTFVNFLLNNRISPDDVLKMRDAFLQKHLAFVSSRHKDTNSVDYRFIYSTDYATFSTYLPIEPTGESKNAFDIFDHSNDGLIDIREMICALSNTIPSFSVKDKCSLMFGLFASGSTNEFISEKELHIILAGTHLKHHKEVSRKAETLLHFVNNNIGPKVSQEQLIEAAIKFPNLLLPKMMARFVENRK